MGRTLRFNVFRYNPQDPESTPHMESFVLQETDSMTLFIALTRIREEQDPSLQFDFCCRAGICGSCGMVINGRPGLACHTKTRDLPEEITLLPLPVFQLVGDLSVDTGSWFRELYDTVESWIHTNKPFEPEAPEERMENSVAEAVYELDRCVECGCCIAACGTARLRPDFLGAAGISKVGRFIVDPRDERSEQDYYEILGTDMGIFGCMGLLACEDVCPKRMPLQDQLGYLRRKTGITALKYFFKRWRP